MARCPIPYESRCSIESRGKKIVLHVLHVSAFSLGPLFGRTRVPILRSPTYLTHRRITESLICFGIITSSTMASVTNEERLFKARTHFQERLRAIVSWKFAENTISAGDATARDKSGSEVQIGKISTSVTIACFSTNLVGSRLLRF